MDFKMPLQNKKEESLPRALLVSIYQQSSQKEVSLSHLNELKLLAQTFGVDPVCQESFLVKKIEASTFIGKGKLEELVGIADDKQVDLVIFDDEMTPAQQRNLEKAFRRRVMDLTEVILGVFAQRAHTKEAKLQVELAKLQYEAPRLKRLWTHLSRQSGTSASGGGGAYLKGEGEKQIEIDKRILKRKMELLRKEIGEVRQHRQTQRLSRLRSQIPVFAIVGYTNAGKSTLLNALTDAGVFVEDKLFATLDTTTRKFTLNNNQEVLLIDTVGFIRKLPHLLVASFKSTLEEATEADILLHLVDASQEGAEEQAATTCAVLKQLGAEKKPIITVFNKIDRVEHPDQLVRLFSSYPKHVQISALTHEGFDVLQEKMIDEIKALRRIMHVRIPQSNYAIVSEILREGNILSQEYEDNDILMTIEVSGPLAARLVSFVQEEYTEKHNCL